MEEQILAVQRMQDYIKMHLDETITMADLADAAHYSPWYSYKLFIRWLNLTPADYIRRLRLSTSALRLRDEQVTITQVAFDTGFGSVDGYQRAFLKEFGRNPGEYLKAPTPIYLFQPYGIRYRELRKEKKMEKVKHVFIQMVEKPARKVIMKRGVKAEDYYSYCEEVSCDVWGLLTSMKSIINEPVCLWLPNKFVKPGTSKYVQGVEVEADYNGEIPEGFDTVDFPACKYISFQGEPFEEEDYCQAIDEVWEAIKKYDPSVIGLSWDEENPRIQLEPVGTRGYIELMAVK